MAPDLNGIGKDGRWDYSTPGAQGYDVPKIDLNVCLVMAFGEKAIVLILHTTRTLATVRYA